MDISTYLVFGDLHGRVLPAFALARRWQREHDIALTALLQVGDLGYFPDPTRVDKATKAHAKRDPLELGVVDVMGPNTLADGLLLDQEFTASMWFTGGNHEDYELLESHRLAGQTDWPVDYYRRIRCIENGRSARLPGGLNVGAIWGIDANAPRARKIRSDKLKIDADRALELSFETFEVLLTHESPRDAIWRGSGSTEISGVIRAVRPQFSFFGHYHEDGRLDECDFGPTQPFRLAGLELGHHHDSAEPHSVGVLTWEGDVGRFEFVADDWLRQFTRSNWKHW